MKGGWFGRPRKAAFTEGRKLLKVTMLIPFCPVQAARQEECTEYKRREKPRGAHSKFFFSSES